MSFRSHGASALALAERKRQRRESRIRERYDRISAALINTDSTRFAARCPTRVIPAVPGIDELSKNEIVRDFREIDASSELATRTDGDEEEHFTKYVRVTCRPSEGEDGTVLKKQERLRNLLQSGSSGDVDQAYLNLLKAKNEYTSFEEERHEWESGFDSSRALYSGLVQKLRDQNRVLRAQSEELKQACDVELNSKIIDVHASYEEYVQELFERENGIRNKLKELESTKVEIASDSLPLSIVDDNETMKKIVAAIRSLDNMSKNCDGNERDVDAFFQEFEDQLKLIEWVALQKEGQKIDNNTAEAHRLPSLSLPDGNVPAIFSHQMIEYIYSSLDSFTSNQVKRKGKKSEINSMSVNARSRTEHNELLLLTPLSRFEDRYFGTLPYNTLFSGEKNVQHANVLPIEVVGAENNCMQRCLMQGDAYGTDQQIRRQRESIQQLRKQEQEAIAALEKAKINYQMSLSDRNNEEVMVMNNLEQYNLQPVAPPPSACESEEAQSDTKNSKRSAKPTDTGSDGPADATDSASNNRKRKGNDEKEPISKGSSTNVKRKRNL